MEKIERQFVMLIKAQGDTPEAIANELHSMANKLRRGELSYGVSGGVTSGCAYVYRENPGQTHEVYFEQIEAEFQADRAAASGQA